MLIELQKLNAFGLGRVARLGVDRALARFAAKFLREIAPEDLLENGARVKQPEDVGESHRPVQRDVRKEVLVGAVSGVQLVPTPVLLVVVGLPASRDERRAWLEG